MKFLCKKIIDRILLSHFLTFKRNFINSLLCMPILHYIIGACIKKTFMHPFFYQQKYKRCLHLNLLIIQLDSKPGVYNEDLVAYGNHNYWLSSTVVNCYFAPARSDKFCLKKNNRQNRFNPKKLKIMNIGYKTIIIELKITQRNNTN